MKQYISLLIAAAIMLSLAACGDKNTQQNNTANDQTNTGALEDNGSSDVQTDEEEKRVSVTLGASFFEGQTTDEIVADAKWNGFSDCEIHSNGSVTYTMSEEKHAEMLKELKTNFEQIVSDCLEGENKAPSFVDIQSNDDLSRIDIYVDADLYSMWDSLYALNFYISGAYYQAFAGAEADKIDVIVSFIDNETQNVLDAVSYKDFISSNESENGADSSYDQETDGVTSLSAQESVSLADICEFYIDFAAITNDVIPPQPGNRYSHYEAASGKIYVDLCVGYKNLKSQSVMADKVLTAALICGQHEYSGFSIIEKSDRSDFTYSAITAIAPLSTEYLHYLFEIPVEAANSSETIEIRFTIGGHTYSYKIR